MPFDPRSRGLSLVTGVLAFLLLVPFARPSRAEPTTIEADPPAAWWESRGPAVPPAGRALPVEVVGVDRYGMPYAATEAGLWRWAGASWVRLGGAWLLAGGAWRRLDATPAFEADRIAISPKRSELAVALGNLLVPTIPDRALIPPPVATGALELSFDGGLTFEPCLPRPPLPRESGQVFGEHGTIAVIAFDPLSPEVAYIATSDGLLHVDLERCADVELRDPRPLSHVVAATGAAGTVLVAASRGSAFGAPSELLRSLDHGATWSAALPNAPAHALWSLAPDPAESTVLWALAGVGDEDQLATLDGQLELWRSLRGGATWRRRSVLPMRGIPLELSVDATGRVFAVVASPVGAHLLRSHDGGRSWSEITPAPSARTGRLAVHPLGLWWSTAAERSPEGGVQIGPPSRLFWSNDGGGSWHELDPPFAPHTTSFEASGLQVVVFGPDPLLSQDSGASWSEVELSLPDGVEVAELRARRRSSSTSAIYTTTDQPGALVVASEDGGLTWTSTPDQPASAGWVAVAESGANRDADVLFYLQPCLVFLCNDPDPDLRVGRALRSDDGGTSWVEVSRPSVPLLDALDATTWGDSWAVAAVGSGFLLRTRRNHLMVSTDGGLTFESWTLPELPGALHWVRILEHESSLVLLLGAEAGVFRTADHGSTWLRADLHPAAYSTAPAVIDPDDPARIWVATDRAGIFESTDSGVTWHALHGLAAGLATHQLAFDADTRTLWAATEAGLFARSRPPLGECVASDTAHCLAGGRFQVEARFRTEAGAIDQSARVLPITADTGAFWFFEPGNVELLVKVLDGCSVNDSRWVYATGLTDVEVELIVTDTESGAQRRIVSADGTAFRPTFDTAAFPCSSVAADP